MNPSEITDQESLKAWLDTQSREAAVTIAHRAAMRVAPAIWRLVVPASRTLDLKPLTLARPILIAGVAGTSPTPAIRSAAETAAAAASAASAYAPAACAAVSAVAADAAAPAADTAGYAADTAVATADVWKSVDADATALDGQATGQVGAAQPLWPGGHTPIANEWAQVREAWAAMDDPGWRFWIDWYEAALAGRPLMGDWDRHWALLTDIALIDPADWNAGPDRVNPLIAAIREKHEIRQRADDLLANWSTLQKQVMSAPNAPRDHNNPPEILGLDHDAYEYVTQAGLQAHAAVEEIAAETRLASPDPEKLEDSANRLADALRVVLKYLGAKADLAVDTLIKLGVSAGVIWMLSNPESVGALVSGARSLVSALSGG